jgi:DNA polymerase-3 subunit delta
MTNALNGIDSTTEIPRLVLVLGDESLLVDRAISAVSAAGRALDPECDVRDLPAAGIGLADLYDLLSPGLFGGGRVVILRDAHMLGAEEVEALGPFLAHPADEVTIVLAHPGGVRGKKLLELCRSAGAHVVTCAPLARAEERMEFLRAEIRAARGTITADAAAALLEAVGSDIREIAAVAAQMVADCGGSIDARAVHAYHRGRADVTGFAVADRAVVGDIAGALETLRWAHAVGVPNVLIADALADGIRSIAKVSSAGSRANPFELASKLGMPPWKVKRAQSQARGWTAPALTAALLLVADLNAAVKGASAHPDYAVERVVREMARLKSQR